MKKLLFLIVLALPYICFAQDIKIDEQMKTLDVDGNMQNIDKIVSFYSFIPKRSFIGPSIAPFQMRYYKYKVYRECEYEVVVLDAGYESFLATQQSKEFFTESVLKGKNEIMVNEWNQRYRQPRHYDPSIYEVSIDYDRNVEYGLEFEYRLYMFFRFMEKQHGISMTNDSRSGTL